MRITEHNRVVKYIKEHPIFLDVLDESILSEYGKLVTEHEHEPDWPCMPEIYCCLMEGTRCNLTTLEEGLKFTLCHTNGQPRGDFLARLRDVNSVGTVFELSVIGSLVLEFGKNNVNPYPTIDNARRVEVQLNLGKQELFIEATVLNFSDDDKKMFEIAKAQDGISCEWLSGTGEGRVIQKVEGKFQRFKKDANNILVLSQYSCLPFHDCGIKALRNYLEKDGHNEPGCHFAGVFYFDRHKYLEWINNGGFLHGPLSDEIEKLKKAFPKMIP